MLILLAVAMLADRSPLRPATMTVVIPEGRCRVVVDGRQLPIEQLEGRLRQAQSTDAEVYLSPNPNAAYQCIDQILRVIKKVPRLNLGFIGNEAYGPEKRK